MTLPHPAFIAVQVPEPSPFVRLSRLRIGALLVMAIAVGRRLRALDDVAIGETAPRTRPQSEKHGPFLGVSSKVWGVLKKSVGFSVVASSAVPASDLI
jgi:hypothetical protein